MKRFKTTSLIVFIVTAILISLSTCSKDPEPEPDPCDTLNDKDSIKALVAKYEFAAETGNLDLFMTCWAEDAWTAEKPVPRMRKTAGIHEKKLLLACIKPQ